MTDDELQKALTRGLRKSNPGSAEEILRLAQRRDREASALRRLTIGTSTAFALIFLGLWSLPQLVAPGLTMKGAGDVGEARLVWVVDGDPGLEVPGSSIPSDAWVIFGVEGSARGFACLDEEGPAGWTRVLPPSGASWPISPGRVFFQVEDAPQAFRTDHGPGQRQYRLRVHPDDASCHGAADIGHWELHWLD